MVSSMRSLVTIALMKTTMPTITRMRTITEPSVHQSHIRSDSYSVYGVEFGEGVTVYPPTQVNLGSLHVS